MAEMDGRAVFLDRDGVINTRYPPYISDWDSIVFYPWTIPALQQLSSSTDHLFLMTNQSGVERGYFSEDQLQTLLGHMHNRLKQKGIRFTRLYYCPHSPGAECGCRKPEPGMLRQAAKEHDLDLSKAWVVGDNDVDIQAGQAVGAKTILLRIRGRLPVKEPNVRPTAVRDHLLSAVDVILSDWEVR